MLAKLTTLMFVTLLSAPLYANDFGHYTEAAKMRLAEERVRATVSKALASRQSYEAAREVASLSPQDQAWAKQYDELMRSEQDKDYLKAALEL